MAWQQDLARFKKTWETKIHGLHLGLAGTSQPPSRLGRPVVGFDERDQRRALGKMGYVGSAPEKSVRPAPRKKTNGTKVNVSPRPKHRGSK